MTVKRKSNHSRAKSEEIVAFGRLIQSLRTSQGQTQEALAEGCGSSQVYVSELERGLKEPCLGMIFRLAAALHVRPAELIDGTVIELGR